MVSLCHSIYIEDLSKTSLRPYDTSHTSTTKIRQMVIKLYDETPAVLMTQNDIDGLFWEGNKETNAAFTFHLNTSDLFYCIRLSNTQTQV